MRTTKRWKGFGHRRLLRGAGLDPAEPEAAALQRGRIVPPLAERLDEIDHGRTVNLRLDVVPRRFRTVGRVEPFCLRVASVSAVVTSAVAQVDAAHESHIVFVAAGVQQQHQLLVVRPATPDPRIQQHDATGFIHDPGEIARLPLVETEYLRMRAPQEPPDLDTPLGEAREQAAEPRTSRFQEFIGVPSPIGQKDLVPGIECG